MANNLCVYIYIESYLKFSHHPDNLFTVVVYLVACLFICLFIIHSMKLWELLWSSPAFSFSEICIAGLGCYSSCSVKDKQIKCHFPPRSILQTGYSFVLNKRKDNEKVYI